MRINPSARGANDELVNLGLIGIASAIGLSALLYGAGHIAAALSGVEQPRGPLSSGMRVLTEPSNPSHALDCPDLACWLYWAVVGTVSIAGVGAAWTVLAWASRQKHRRAADPRQIPGIATRRDVYAAAGAKALLRRADVLRPSLARPRPADVGYLLGRSCGRPVWASVEDSILIVGPPRSGKGLHLVINAISTPRVRSSPRPPDRTTSPRPSPPGVNVARSPSSTPSPSRLACLTCGPRTSAGPRSGAARNPDGDDRASGLAASTGLSSGGVESGGFWEGKTRTALQALLHAAALEHLPTRTLFEWSLSPSAAGDAVGILSGHPGAAAGWSDALQSIVTADARTRDSIWMGVSQSLASLADPRVLDAVSPQPASTSTPPSSSPTTEPSISSRPVPAPARPGHSSPRSSRTSQRPHAASHRPRPALGLIHRCCSRSTRSATSRRSPPFPSSWPKAAAPASHDARTSIAGPGPQPLGRPRRQLHLGRLHRQSDPRWRLRVKGSSRTLGPDRRARGSHRVTIGWRVRRPLETTITQGLGHAPERIRTLPFGTALILLRSAPPVVVDLRPGPRGDPFGM